MTPWTWCPWTKKQGFAGGEAPRLACRRPIESRGRGAPGRRNKGLRGAKHHVRFAVGPLDPVDVVPLDEGIMDCEERSTTSDSPSARWTRGTWCPWTKKQGIAGSEAPRRARRRPNIHVGGLSCTLPSNHRFFTQKTAQYGKMISHITGRRQPRAAPEGPSFPKGSPYARRVSTFPEGRPQPKKRGTHYAVERRA